MTRWFAVFTRPRQETLAETHLRRQGFTTFLPRLVDRQGERPLFTSYLFIADQPGLPLFTVNATRGVRRVLMFGEQPQSVREVDVLREACDERGRLFLDAPDDAPRPGDLVRLRESCPLFGYLCEVTQVEAAGLRVLVHMFGRKTPAVIAREDVGEVLRSYA